MNYWCVPDDAMFTDLQGHGLESGHCAELWYGDWPDHNLCLHNSFKYARSDLFLTGSFGGSRFRLQLHDAQERIAGLNAGGEVAR